MFFPRNKESKKPVYLPKDFDEEVSGLFVSEFKGNLEANQNLDVKTFLYKNELICRLYVKISGQLKQQVFEVSMDYTSLIEIDQEDLEQKKVAQQAEEIQELVSLAVDYLSVCLDTFLTESKTPSSEWTKVDFQKQILFIRHHTSNLDLEEQANKLLGDAFLGNLNEEL